MAEEEEEKEEEEEERSVISVCSRGRKSETVCLRVCFPICSPATISVSSVYMLFMSLTYMCPCLCVHVRPCLCVCVCVCVCAIQFMPEKSDKVPVHFPRFTNHFHGLTTQFDIFSYNRERSPDDSLHCVYAFFPYFVLLWWLQLLLRLTHTCPGLLLLLLLPLLPQFIRHRLLWILAKT